MNINIIGNWIGKLFGVSLPKFDEGEGSVGSLLLQWLYSPSKRTDVVKADGYTYVKDAAAQGTDRNPRQGSARDYDGINGVTTIPHSADLTFGNGTTDQPFSISAWVNMDDATTFSIFSKSAATNEVEYILQTDASDLLFFGVYDGSNFTNRETVVTTALTSYENQDLFIVATYDGSQANTGLELYVYDANQTLLLTTDTRVSAGTYTAMDGASISQFIGKREPSVKYSNGTIWDVRVHNTELTATEIANLVQNPTYLTGHEVGHWRLDEEAGTVAFDSTGNDNHGIDTGGVIHVSQDVVSWPNKQGYHLADYFDGASDYISLSSLSVPDIGESIKCECYLLINGTLQYILGAEGGGNNDYPFSVNSSNLLVVRANGVNTSFASIASLTSGWYTVEVTRDSVTDITINLYDKSGGLIYTDTQTGISTANVGVKSISASVSNATPRENIIKSVEVTNKGKWTVEGGWLDEIGSNDGTINGSPTDCILPIEVVGTPDYTGTAPHDGRLVQSHCGTFDGVSDWIDFGDCGNVTSVSMWVRLAVDDQYLFSLANTAATTVRVLVGALNFGSSLTHSNLTVDGVTKTLVEAGALLNDNTWHLLEFDLVSVAATSTRLARTAGNYGNIEVAQFNIGTLNAPLAEGEGLVAHDISGNGNHGTINATASAFWA